MSLEHWKQRQRQAKEKVEVKIGREMSDVESAFFEQGFWEGYYSGGNDHIDIAKEAIRASYPNMGKD